MQKLFIRDYLKTFSNASFDDVPFNEVDAAILAVLSYADYIASGATKKFDIKKDEIPLSIYNKHETIKLLSRRYLSGVGVYYDFFKSILESNRFKGLRITRIENRFSEEKTAQFFAMMYKIDNKKIIIYRGTDNTIVGWKEDVLTAVKNCVPAQKYALQYLNKILREEKGDVYVIGHSKGGNLAYYSFFNTSAKNKKRIPKVFNLDGNGFRNDQYDYQKYKDKIVKMVPSDDVVGCIFDNTNNHEVVVSNAFSIMCHDMLTWCIDPTNLVQFTRANDLTRLSKAFQISLNNWLYQLNDEDIEDFVDFIFMFFDLDKPRTLKDLFNSLTGNTKKYVKSVDSYPDEKRKRLQYLSNAFIKDFLYSYIYLKPLTSENMKKISFNNLLLKYNKKKKPAKKKTKAVKLIAKKEE